MYRNIVRSLALVAALGVAACGDDGPVATGDPLTEAEVAALSEIILTSAFLSPSGAPNFVEGGPQGAPVSFSESVELTVPCEGGGSVNLTGSASGTVDDETGEFDLAFSLGQAHSSCVATAQNEQTFELDSSMSLVFNFEGTFDQEVTTLDWDGALTGSVDWETGEKSGGCSVDLSYAASFTGQSITASTNGAVCGVTVDNEFNVSYGG